MEPFFSLTGWKWRQPSWQRDLLLAMVIVVLEIVFTHFAGQRQPGRRPLDIWAIVLLTAGGATLMFRRQRPVAALFVCLGATMFYWDVNYPGGPVFLPLVITFFTLALRGKRLAAWLSLGVGYLGFLWLPFVLGLGPAPGIPAILGLAGWLLVLGAAAEVARARREHILDARRTRTEAERRRASEERLRMARDLHDVLAHDISLINVQAGVALHLLDEQPEQARTALTAIKNSSKDALSELRSVLDMLRSAGEEAPRRPSPGLPRIDELVSGVEAAGLAVRTSVSGELKGLPAGIELVAYRIVQEALTNIIRHARRATSVTIMIGRNNREITLRIDDDGSPQPGFVTEGTGIKGMRERAAAVGGTIEAGPLPDGGFRVMARLPLGDGR